MAAKGYITNAASSRRFAGSLLVLYVLAFELIGGVALTIFLLLLDPEHTIVTNPVGYVLRYGLPIALVSALIFLRLYRGHAKAVAAALEVRMVTRANEPRFVDVAEQACTTLGVRFPRFGLIETPEPNALTVGEGPSAGLMVATRGLLDRLDDDELAAVFAHEASHIRQGDTRIFAANHALMRTAVLWQVNNPLRIEDWRQLVLLVLLPPFLVLLLAGGAVTMLSLGIARFARRGIKLSRDHVADGDAVRVTHFPEALLSALNKVGGRGAFPGSSRVEGLLFDGPADQEGGSHPAVSVRLKTIHELGKSLLDDSRQRRDTRVLSGPRFQQPRPQPRTLYPTDSAGRPLQQPPTPTVRQMALRFTDPEAYCQLQQATIAWWEWRISDRRNVFGITPRMVIPVAAACVFSLVFWWPGDNDLSKFGSSLDPSAIVELGQGVTSGPFCTGPSYSDGRCPEYDYSAAQIEAQQKQEKTRAERPLEHGPPDNLPGLLMFLLIFGGLIARVFRPFWLRRLSGVVDATPEQLGGRTQATRTSRDPVSANPVMSSTKTFGRKRV